MKKKKKRHLFEIEILHNITNVFTLTFDKLQTVLDSVHMIFCYVTQWHSYIFQVWLKHPNICWCHSTISVLIL